MTPLVGCLSMLTTGILCFLILVVRFKNKNKMIVLVKYSLLAIFGIFYSSVFKLWPWD